MNNEALLATATAKSAAHTGLADALENGRVRALRVNGVETLTADFDGEIFHLSIDNITGAVECRGYRVNSTCRDLAYDALRRIRRA